MRKSAYVGVYQLLATYFDH